MPAGPQAIYNARVWGENAVAYMEILIILLLVLFNGVLAMSEIAVVSARRVRLQQWAAKGDKRAAAALALAQEPGHFLSTIQVGITLVGILSGAYGEATVAAPLARALKQVPALAPYGDAIAFAAVVTAITVLSLVIGELVPKRVALLNAERVASLVAVPMRRLSLIVYPLVKLLSAATDGVLRMLGAQPSKEPPITEEEIRVLMQQGTEAGIFEKAEQDLVRNVFLLDRRGIGGLMTPKPDVVYLDVEDSTREVLRKIDESGHSLYPVCKGDLDNVLGIVQTKALLARCLAGAPLDLTAVLQAPLYVPESLSAMELLKVFKQSPVEAALAIDEYGEIQGIVTLGDVLEAVVGEMPSAGEGEEAPAVQREDGSWLLDGMLPVDQLKTLFRIEGLPEEETRSYNTVAGFIMSQLGRVPAVADHFEWHGLRFEVADMDRARIDKVLVIPAKGQGEPAGTPPDAAPERPETPEPPEPRDGPAGA